MLIEIHKTVFQKFRSHSSGGNRMSRIYQKKQSLPPSFQIVIWLSVSGLMTFLTVMVCSLVGFDLESFFSLNFEFSSMQKATLVFLTWIFLIWLVFLQKE